MITTHGNARDVRNCHPNQASAPLVQTFPDFHIFSAGGGFQMARPDNFRHKNHPITKDASCFADAHAHNFPSPLWVGGYRGYLFIQTVFLGFFWLVIAVAILKKWK
jgi:hypothetical protein